MHLQSFAPLVVIALSLAVNGAPAIYGRSDALTNSNDLDARGEFDLDSSNVFRRKLLGDIAKETAKVADKKVVEHEVQKASKASKGPKPPRKKRPKRPKQKGSKGPKPAHHQPPEPVAKKPEPPKTEPPKTEPPKTEPKTEPTAEEKEAAEKAAADKAAKHEKYAGLANTVFKDVQAGANAISGQNIGTSGDVADAGADAGAATDDVAAM